MGNLKSKKRVLGFSNGDMLAQYAASTCIRVRSALELLMLVGVLELMIIMMKSGGTIYSVELLVFYFNIAFYMCLLYSLFLCIMLFTLRPKPDWYVMGKRVSFDTMIQILEERKRLSKSHSSASCFNFWTCNERKMNLRQDFLWFRDINNFQRTISSACILMLASFMLLFLFYWDPKIMLKISFCWILTNLCWLSLNLYFVHSCIMSKLEVSSFMELLQLLSEESFIATLPCPVLSPWDVTLLKFGCIVLKAVTQLNLKVKEGITKIGL